MQITYIIIEISYILSDKGRIHNDVCSAGVHNIILKHLPLCYLSITRINNEYSSHTPKGCD